MYETELLSEHAHGVIEINPGRRLRDEKDNWLGFPIGALEALKAIDAHMNI